MNTIKRIYAVLVCISIVLMTAATVITAQAVPIATDTPASLSITIAPDGQPLAGVSYSIYKVADVTADGGFILLDMYKDSEMSPDINNTSAANLRVIATTLKGYVAHKAIAPDYVGQTDENGVAVFSDIPCGLYLVKGAPVLSGSEYVIPTPLMISVPTGSSDEWNYDVCVNGKYTVHPEYESVYVEVLKVWHDEQSESRPLQIVVHLYNGDEFYDSVVLNRDNNWKFAWENLPMGDWSVYEQNIPAGYFVCIEQQVYRYVVANSSPPDDEPSTEPTTTPPDETTTSPDETTTGPDETTTEEPPDEPTTKPPNTPPELPYTGQLWWPVPFLSFAGLMFVLFGYIGRRGEEE